MQQFDECFEPLGVLRGSGHARPGKVQWASTIYRCTTLGERHVATTSRFKHTLAHRGRTIWLAPRWEHRPCTVLDRFVRNSAPEASAPLSPRSICDRDARSELLQDVHVHSRKALATMFDLPLAKSHEEAPAAVARELPARRESQTSVRHRTKHTSRCTGMNSSVTWRHGGRDGLPIL